MAPHVIMDDYYWDYHYVGGAFQLLLTLGAAVLWETSLSTVTGKRSGQLFFNRRFLSRLPLIELDEAAIGRAIPYYRDMLAHGCYDDYWRSLSTRGRHGQITVPVFQQCGWFDAYAGSTLRNWKAMTAGGGSESARANQRVLMGPWSHEEPAGTRLGDWDFGPQSYLVIRDEELRWWDRWLKGADGGPAGDPPLRLFVMGVNEWRSAEDWPLPGTQFTDYYLHSCTAAAGPTRFTATGFCPPNRRGPNRPTASPTTRTGRSRRWAGTTRC
jgi:putative CocE/NonD family hydrolase